MSGSKDFKVEEVFESAVAIVKNLPQEGPFKPSDKLKLKLYALYKQATFGPNTTSKPRFYQIVEQYKWDAWMKLGDMPREEAMAKYIDELKDVMESIPNDQTNPEDNKRFEEVLGKKFYDYWFNEWNQKPSKRNRSLAAASSSYDSAEETPEQDGYKTPTSFDQWCCITSDQFAMAVLRLQSKLEQAESRLARLEGQSRQRASQPRETAGKSMASISWFYLSYPILVYLILRAFERWRKKPSSSSSLMQ